jgi:hypothetical protein
MKKFAGKKRSARYLILIALAISTLTATPAHAAVVSFNCPVGGGTYQVNNGQLTGTTGTCGGNLVLDNSVTAINYLSLAGTAITSLTIPASVQTITNPFYYTTNLVSITVDNASTTFKTIDDVLFDFAGTTLIAYPASKPGTSYTIPNSVTEIGIYAFGSTKYLTSVSISNGVTTTQGGLFIGAQALTTVNIGTGLTNLGEQNFAWIRTLTSINVDASNASFASIGGILYNKNITKLWAYPAGKTGTSYTAPNTVTSTAYTVFGAAMNLLTVDLTSVSSLSGQEFLDATSVREIIFGNSLTNLKSQVLQSASGLRKLTLGTGLTTITNGAFYGNTNLYCVIYGGNNPAIQNYAYPNGVVPVSSSASCLQDPAFTLSTSTITATIGIPVTSYAVTSAGGAIASFSISPAISNTPGLSFSTSTGLISGTPTTAASSRTYTITATNAANTASRTFSITVQASPPTPFLRPAISPKMKLVDGKFVCSAGTYEFGNTISGVIDQDSIFLANPNNFTYGLLINGITQGSLSVTNPNKSNMWSLADTGSGSIVACSVSVTVNSLTSVGRSTDNTTGLPAAQSAQRNEIVLAKDTYDLAVRNNSKVYQKALEESRANWQKQTSSIRANYYDTLNRIKVNGGSKLITDTKNALAVKMAAQKTAASDYASNKQAALAARDAANKNALATNLARITKANALYGTFIESIGYGVLIP